MSKQRYGNKKLSAPTSDSDGDMGRMLERIVDQIGDLRDAAARGLPSRYRLGVTREGDLQIIDKRTHRVANVQLEWKDQTNGTR